MEDLEQEVRDVAATCRGRMRWLEAAAESAQRRLEALFRQLQASAPLSVRIDAVPLFVPLAGHCSCV